MPSGPVYDLRIGIHWTQTGLNELVQQAQSQLSRLRTSAAGGNVLNERGEQATPVEVGRAVRQMKATFANEAKQFGDGGIRAVNKVFGGMNKAIVNAAKTAEGTLKTLQNTQGRIQGGPATRQPVATQSPTVDRYRRYGSGGNQFTQGVTGAGRRSSEYEQQARRLDPRTQYQARAAADARALRESQRIVRERNRATEAAQQDALRQAAAARQAAKPVRYGNRMVDPRTGATVGPVPTPAVPSSGTGNRNVVFGPPAPRPTYTGAGAAGAGLPPRRPPTAPAPPPDDSGGRKRATANQEASLKRSAEATDEGTRNQKKSTAELTADRVASLRQSAQVREGALKALAADNTYAATRASGAALQTRINAEEQALTQVALATDTKYIEATALAARARETAAARVTLAGAGEDYTKLNATQALTRAASINRVQAEQQRTAALRGITREEIEIMARNRAEQAKLNAAIRQRERAYIREALKSGELQAAGLGGSRFQQLQARFGTAAGKAPTDYATLGQFVGQKATTTLGYGIAGAATGALFFGISDMVKDAGELENTFVKLQGQLEGLGKGGEFDTVRDKIKEIAADTGMTAGDIAQVSQRLIGIYGKENIGKAMEETSSAMKLAVVAGLDVKTTLESVIPTTKAFGVSVEDLGDIAVGASDKFGLTVDDFVQFAGKAAVVSKTTGLGLRELTIVAGNMGKSLGVPLESSAETFNKLPEQVQVNQNAIRNILRSGGDESAGYIKKFDEALAGGKQGQAIIEVLGASRSLSEEQKRRLAGEIAVNREVEQGIAILSSADDTIRDLADGNLLAANGAGKMGKRFADLQDTVGQTFKRIGRALENFTETLYSSGISDVFATIGTAIEGVVGSLTIVTGAFRDFNNVTKFDWGPFQVPDGVLGTFLKLGLVTVAATKSLTLLNSLRKGDKGAKAGGTEAENADATAREKTAVAANDAALSIEREAAARTAGIGPATQSAEAENVDAASRERAAAAANSQAAATGRAAGAQAAGATGAAGAASRYSGAAFGAQRAPVSAPLSTAPVQYGSRWVNPQTGATVAAPVTAGAAPVQYGGRWINPQTGAAVNAPGVSPIQYGGRWIDPRTGAAALPPGAGTAGGIAPPVPPLPRRTPLPSASNQGVGGPMPPVPPTQAFGAWQKATYGGSGIFRNKAADAAAKAAGRDVGGGLKPNAGQGFLVAGLVIAGAAMVKDAYDGQKEKVEGAANELRERLKGFSQEALTEASKQHTDFFDRFTLRLFGQDLPEELAEAARTAKEFEGSDVQKRMKALGGDTKLSEQFSKDISDQNLKTIEGFFEQSDVTEDLARKAGLDVEGPSNVNRIASLGLGAVTGGLGAQLADRFSYEGGNVTLDRKNLPQALKTLNEAAAGPDEKQAEAAKKALQSIDPVLLRQANMQSLKKDVDDLVAKGDLKGAADKAGGIDAFVDQSLDTIKKQYDAGQITTGQYLAQMGAKSAELRAQIQSGVYGTGTDDQKKALDKLAQWDKENAKVRDSVILNRIESAGALAELQGSSNAAGASLQARLAALPELSQQTRLEQLPKLVDELKSSFTNELAQIADPLERARRAAAGFELPQEVQDLFAEQAINNAPEAQNMLATLAPLIGQSVENVTAWAVKTMRENKLTLEQAIIKGLRDQRKKLEAEAWAKSGGKDAGTLRSIFRTDALASTFADIDKAVIEQLKAMGGGQAGVGIEQLKGFYNKNTDDMSLAIVELAEQENISFKDAYVKLAQAAKDRVERESRDDGVIDAYEQRRLDILQGAIDGADAAFGGGTELQSPGTTGKTDTGDNLARGVLEAEAAKKKLAAETRAAMQPRNRIAQAQSEIDQAQADVLLEQAALGDKTGGDTAKLQAALNRLSAAKDNMLQGMEAIEDAELDWTEIRAGEDPVEQNRGQMIKAQVALARARRDGDKEGVIRGEQEIYKLQTDADKNQQAILDSRLSVQEAIFESDPVKSAQLALQRAESAVANAEGEVNKNEAEAARIRAARGLEEALSNLISSRVELAMAIADASGDSAKSAELAAEDARRKLNEAIARGASEAVLNPLDAASRAADANAFRSRLSQDREGIDFMRDMGKITISQTMEAYKALLARTTEGTDEYMDLMRAIKAMETELGTDLQFNLPTTLGLPTLYEARRTTQGMAQGIGYQDNRNVVVAVNINGAQDPAAVAAQVSSALQNSLRGGTITTPAVLVGA